MVLKLHRHNHQHQNNNNNKLRILNFTSFCFHSHSIASLSISIFVHSSCCTVIASAAEKEFLSMLETASRYDPDSHMLLFTLVLFSAISRADESATISIFSSLTRSIVSAPCSVSKVSDISSHKSCALYFCEMRSEISLPAN